MFSIARKEFNQFFSSLTGFITIILFLLVNGIFLFVLKDSNIFDFGYATLDKFFQLAPWIFIFLIPAITMRVLSDEYRTGTIEILRTRPLSGRNIILGKYLAVVLVILIALLPTIIYVTTIRSLSANGIDSGGILGSYIGLFLLAVSFAAIGIWCSGFTTNPIVAFLISATACLVFYFGFNAVSQLAGSFYDYYVEMMGIDFHYRSISRGVVDTRDVIYFLSVIFFFLFITQPLPPGLKRIKKQKVLGLSGALGAVLLINILAAKFHSRFDLTNEKRFTLSKPVKKMLSSLNDPVNIEVFLKGQFPSGFKKLAASTEDVLEEFRQVAGGNVSYRFVSPDEQFPGTSRTYADTLVAMGANPINLTFQVEAGKQQQFVYPFALVHYNDRIYPVELYSGNKVVSGPAELNSAEAMMEYRFASAIANLTTPAHPMIGYLTGNGEPTDGRVYDLMQNVLPSRYNTKTIDLSKQPLIPDTFKSILIVKPTIPFTDQDKLKIDQYVMNGGHVLWFIDRLEAELDSLQANNQVVAYDRNLNLEDMLFRYGVRINPDLVMDLQCDFLPWTVNANGQIAFIHWNYFPLFESKSDHPVNQNLGLISGRFVNSIDTVKAENVKKTILLSTSANSRTISTPALISGNENREVPQDALFNKKDIPVAVLLEGDFTSVFANRVSQAMQDSIRAYGGIFQRSSVKPGSMIIVGDGDVVLNGVSKGEFLPMGVNQFTIGTQYEYQFANRDFMENSMDYLVDAFGLSEAKAKDYKLRLLDPVRAKDERLKWQIMNIGLPIILITLFGLLFQWIRKRKYTHGS